MLLVSTQKTSSCTHTLTGADSRYRVPLALLPVGTAHAQHRERESAGELLISGVVHVYAAAVGTTIESATEILVSRTTPLQVDFTLPDNCGRGVILNAPHCRAVHRVQRGICSGPRFASMRRR